MQSIGTEVAEGLNEVPVFVVRGANWTCTVPLDEYNTQFSPLEQAQEAASRAIEAFKGQDYHKLVINLDEGEEEPFLSVTLWAHLKDTDPDKGFLLFSHELFANGGFYKEALAAETELTKHIKQIAAEQKKSQENYARVQEQIKNFEKFQAEMAAKPAKKSAKKIAPKNPRKKKK